MNDAETQLAIGKKRRCPTEERQSRSLDEKVLRTMRYRGKIKRGLMAALLAAAWGCNQPPGDEETPCVSGRSEPCGCADGRTGAQICAADGQKFLECNCEDRIDGGGAGGERADSDVASENDRAIDAGAVIPAGGGAPAEDSDASADVPQADAAAQEPDTPDVDGINPRCPTIPAADMHCESMEVCDAALAIGGLEVFAAENEEHRQRLHLESYMCDLRNSESIVNTMVQTHDTLGFSIPKWFELDADASNAERRQIIERWQHDQCSEEIQNMQIEDVLEKFSYINDPSPALAAWLECVKEVASSQLSCLASRLPVPMGLACVIDNDAGLGDLFQLVIRWCGGDGDWMVPEVEVDTFNIAGATCDPPPHDFLVPPRNRLPIGERTLLCTRDADGDPVLASLTAKAHVGRHERSYRASAWLQSICGAANQPACQGVCDLTLTPAPNTNICCPEWIAQTLWGIDRDNDGHGGDGQVQAACLAPEHYAAIGTDCDDSEAEVHPGAVELCNERDDDCDGDVDEGAQNACGSCGPVPEEVCNGADDNCNGTVDEGVRNACGGCGPVPEEVCNGADDNCNGVIDEGVDICGADFVGCCANQECVEWMPRDEMRVELYNDDFYQGGHQTWRYPDGTDGDFVNRGFNDHASSLKLYANENTYIRIYDDAGPSGSYCEWRGLGPNVAVEEPVLGAIQVGRCFGTGPNWNDHASGLRWIVVAPDSCEMP